MSVAEVQLMVPSRRSDASSGFAPQPVMAVKQAGRLPMLDLLRAVSAHVIVWHHLLIYGPLSETVSPLYPLISDFLIEHGRNAVQVFLVIGGFVTAQSLGKRQEFSLQDVWAATRKRYVRIGGPYLAVLLIAVIANWLAQQSMEHASISEFPTIPQFLAHTVFLHDILGYEALSAGVWYLAIDFQLGLLAVTLWWLSQRCSASAQVGPVVSAQILIWPLAVASLYWFNRHPHLDVWALYFFGSYALGLITAWALSGKLPRWTFWLYAGLMVLAIAIEFRPRLVVALSTGLVVFGAGRLDWLAKFPTNRVVQFAGASSYSLFLVHFPVCLLVNAWVSPWVEDSPALACLGLFAAYGLSLLASIVFYFGVERLFQQERLLRFAAAS